MLSTPPIFPLAFPPWLHVVPKWLTLLPGLGMAPAPRGDAQAGGPQCILASRRHSSHGFQQELNNYQGLVLPTFRGSSL